MTTRMVESSPYQSASSSAEKKEKPFKVKVKARIGGEHNSGIEPDNLHSALAYRQQTLPTDHIVWTHTTMSQPRGAHYNPTEDFRKLTPTGEGKGVYSYGGAPNTKGENPLGSPSNKKGDNSLGRAMNKVGSNAIGKHSNKTGSKSGYPKFTPKGGGKNV